MLGDIKSKLAKLFEGPRDKPVLSRSTVEHDSVDEMVFRTHAVDSQRFKRIAIDEPPIIVPEVDEPPAPDFSSATPDEIKTWQEAVNKARAARNQADPYAHWEDLCRDYFYLHHHPSVPTVLSQDEIDPAVTIHRKIAEKTTTLDDFPATRNVTRDDATMSAMAVMAAAKHGLKELLTNELKDQLEQSRQFDEQRDAAQDAMASLEDLRDEARDLHERGLPVPPQLVEDIRGQVKAKRGAIDKAAQIADNPIPFSASAQRALEKLAADVRQASEQAAATPHFGQGFGQDEPQYESPEQALAIADAWSSNPTLIGITMRYGRFDPDMRFKRAKRVVGGQDEIVDLEFGDNLKRVLFSELGALAQDEEILEDDFFARYLSGDLLIYTTVGEEHAGRGPMGLVIDGSSSMSGDRNMWARAVALCILNIARREKRDMFVVEYASVNQMASWEFPAKSPLDAQKILDMASHFFSGTTHPLVGITEADRIIANVKEFKKADMVILSDGECSFTSEDKIVRDRLKEKGVRIHGIGIGDQFKYLAQMCDPDTLTHIHDFELSDPSAATTMLATHLA